LHFLNCYFLNKLYLSTVKWMFHWHNMTNSMEQNHLWEADSHSANQDIYPLVWNLPLVDPVVNQMNPTHILFPWYPFKKCSSVPTSSEWSFVKISNDFYFICYFVRLFNQNVFF
jgi:hypothetical protein